MTPLLLALALQCPDGAPPPCRRAAVAPAANSVAVLYFDNRSDSSDAYLADGVTEEVITRLAGIERISVRSRHLVRRYRGSELLDPAAVGRALGVTYLVTGSVRRAGERLRVSAELIRASSGEQVWGRQFDQAGGDVFAIQEGVARDVATGIIGRLISTETRALAARPTASAAAHDAYLRGNFFFSRRDSVGFARALQEYGTALRLDSGYAAAAARIAMIYGVAEIAGFPLPLSYDTVLARTTRFADMAVRRAPASADAWIAVAMARQLTSPRDPRPALEAARRAVQIDSSDAEAHQQLGSLHSSALAFDSAEVHWRRALAIDPLRPITVTNIAQQAAWHGRWDEAQRWNDSALRIDPDFGIAHAMALAIAIGRRDSALARRVARGWESQPSLRSAAEWAHTILNLRGSRDSAGIAGFRSATMMNTQVDIPAGHSWLVAILWLHGLDDREGALTAFEKGRRSAVLATMMQGEPFAALRGEPRFQRVLRESQP